MRALTGTVATTAADAAKALVTEPTLLTLYRPVFRIRMDPGFFADPDPDFKNTDTDPSVFCFKLFLGSNEN